MGGDAGEESFHLTTKSALVDIERTRGRTSTADRRIVESARKLDPGRSEKSEKREEAVPVLSYLCPVPLAWKEVSGIATYGHTTLT